MTGTDITHVPFKGVAENTASLLGGGLYQFSDKVFTEFAGMVRR